MAMDKLCRGGLAALPFAIATALTLTSVAMPAAARAQESAQDAAAPVEPALTYADLASLIEAAPMIAVVAIQDQATVEPERSPGLAPGSVRLYLEAQTEALLAGRSAVGESLVFLADRALMPNGRAPRLRKQRFIIFAETVPGRPGQLQLIDPGAMIPAEPVLLERLRSVIAAFAAPELPPVVTGVRDVISVPGNLTGESETQMFVETASGAPVSLSVVRRPGMEPSWGVSWGEIVDASARPPQPETVEWYRLACSLPADLPEEAFLQEDGPSRQQAREDYRYILQQLGPCERIRD
jgi:hypothetical protein